MLPFLSLNKCEYKYRIRAFLLTLSLAEKNLHNSALIGVQVAIDNSTTSAYSLINIVCKDRKGLVYDLMRTVKDIHIRVAYGKVHVRQDYMCEADLFVQEVDGSQITEQ